MTDDLTDMPRRLDAVHFGHFPVDQDQIIVLPPPVTDADLVHALPAGFRRIAAYAHLAENDFRVFKSDPVVVDHQNAHILGNQIILFGWEILSLRFAQRNGYRKNSALALFAFYLNVAVHELHDALGDRHAQARRTVAAGGGRVLLAEGVKNPGQKLLAHTDAGVADDKAERRLPVIARSLLDHKADRPALRRELDRVAENVDHHLLELRGVADIIIVHLTDDAAVVDEPLVPALAADDRVDLLQRLGKGELLLFDGHASGFDAAHVQDVVDDPQQMMGGIADLSQVFLDLIAGRGIVHGDVVQTDDRVHWGADLVAHVGQECRLGFICFLGCAERLRQRLVFCHRLPHFLVDDGQAEAHCMHDIVVAILRVAHARHTDHFIILFPVSLGEIPIGNDQFVR